MKFSLFKTLTICLLLFVTGGPIKAQALPGAACPLEVKTQVLDSGSMEYFTVGKGDSILLLHGLFGQKEQWIALSCELALAGFQVIAPDLPGYGKSTGFEMDDYRLERQSLLVHQFVRSLGVNQMHLGGSSMGGAIASLYARQYPAQIRSLAFIGGPMGVGPWSTKVKNTLYQGINPFIPISIDQFNLEMSLLFYEPPVIPYELKEQLVAEYVQRNRHYQQVWDIADHYGDVILKQKASSVPTLILWGADDGIFESSGISKLKSQYPRNQSVIYEKASHLLMLEIPQKISDVYSVFMRSTTGY